MKLLHLKLLLYLDKGGALNDMKNASEDFLEGMNDKTVSKFPPFRYLLRVDVMDMLELFPELGDFLIREPLIWQRYCNYILFACLKSLDNDMNQHIQLSQVAVNVRLQSLPHVFHNSQLRNYTGISSFNGLLVSMTKPMNYVFHTVWTCPQECEDNEIILQYIPKVPPKCYLCRSTLFENSGLRMCGDQVDVTFKLENDLLPKKMSIVDDLIDNLKLGANYFVNAVVLKKATAVWCLEEKTLYLAPTTSLIPPDITKMLEDCDNKPWKFIYGLASGIGVHVCPLNCFMNIKVYLLLSIVSVKANNLHGSSLLHFLATGFDTGYVAELMGQARLLAYRNVILGTSNCNVSTALIGASGGVCVMPLPLQVYNQKQIHSIITTIETGEICHETNKVQLNCAIWAHGVDIKRNAMYDVARVFGIISRIDYGEYTDELADFALQQAIDPSKASSDQKPALLDVLTYIEIIAAVKVSIEEDCQNLLSNYFLAARRVETKTVPVGNMEFLVTTCAMSARLCRRSIANIDDAVFAIWLHVCSMSNPRLAPEEYLQTPTDINKLQSVIEKFIHWLELFTGCYITNKI